MDKRIGAQLYTLRDFTQTKEDFEKSMKRVHDIGYKAVQISAVGPIAPEDMREICQKYDLAIACTHKGFDDYVSRPDELISTKNSAAILRVSEQCPANTARLKKFPNWSKNSTT